LAWWLGTALLCLAVFAGLLAPASARGDNLAEQRDLAAASEFAGRTVESVEIQGNTQVSTSVIRELIRTREGEKFDPSTAVEDYQRIYDKLKMFANVEALVQPTRTGVIVVFKVIEQRRIEDIRYLGNVEITTDELRKVVELKKGEALDLFRVNLARQAIEKLYRDKNYPSAHVTVPAEELQKTGVVTFHVVEGPEVRIRKVDFIGNNNFSAWKLKDQIQTAYYVFIFRPGTFDPQILDEDVAALHKFYNDKGFFDARIGRKLTRSADMKSMEVTFVIDEGPRYVIEHVDFKGLNAVSEAALRQNMTMVEGRFYDSEGIENDRRSMVKAYSKAGGYIYEEQPGIAPNPEYLQIRVKPWFKKEPGKLDLVYDISEGKQFTLGRILIKGNSRTKDNVILREMRMRPGQLYNSAEVEDAVDRLRGTRYFTTVSASPIGDDAHVRDLLVDLNEEHTADIGAGVSVSTSGGLGAELSYEQRNFDITNIPTSWGEFFSDRAFTGAGQDFLISFLPSTLGTSTQIAFTEPHLFDQPYSLSTSGYFRQRIEESANGNTLYTDQRAGGTVSVGERFNYIYSGSVSLRAEDIDIRRVQDPTLRAAEIVNGQGHHTLTSIGLEFQRDTTNHGPVVYEGTNIQAGVIQVGAMGGTVNFTRLTSSIAHYITLNEDLLGRKSVLNAHIEADYDPVKAPFFDRFYGGGTQNLRGFGYWGVSPRQGPQDDPIGGDFSITGGLEYTFPLAEDFLRGVLFVDAGDIESDPHFGVIRTSAGFGFRLTIPFFPSAPLALDFGFPMTENRQDNEQVLSFSFQISR
jgi:outer membrane protein insertion porin family